MTLRNVLLAPVALYGVVVGFMVALLAAPVLVLQALRWLRVGAWAKISLRTIFHLQNADTGWIGLNTILDQLTEGELAAAIVIAGAALLLLSLVIGWIATAGDAQ
jgi:hypothetical protein